MRSIFKKFFKFIFEQSFKDWEIIFFNNASNDQSEKIAESLEKNKNIQFLILYQSREG